MHTITVLDTAAASTNLGDQIIMEAVRRELDALLPDAFKYSVATHEWMGRRSQQLVERADVAVVGGSNLLSSRMWFRPLWKLTPLQAFRRGEIVLMGAGWYQDQGAADVYSRWLLRRVLSRHALHSVRDGQAQRMLKGAGIDNVVNTGCPTIWSLTPEHCAKIPRSKSASVVTTLNTYIPKPDADRLLLETLRKEYQSVYFWTQTEADRAYADGLADGLIHIEPSLAGFDRLLAAETSLDYVGNRLHAGIRALQHHRRAIIVEIDNRARAMGADVGLPTVQRTDMDRLRGLINQPFETAIAVPVVAIQQWRDRLSSTVAAARSR